MTLKMKCFLIIIFSCFLTSPTVVDKAFDSVTGTQWHPYYEWKIKNRSFKGNPFDVEGHTVFYHDKTGQSIKVPMFYDRENTWKFRFTGTETGTWTLETFSEDEELNGWTGQITINKNPDKKAHGFMRAFGKKWGWQGTEEAFIPQYVMAKQPLAYLKADSTVNITLVEQDIEEFIDEHGFTGFHLPVKGKWFAGHNPDPHIYQVVETIIEKIHQRGGSCHIWLWGSGSDKEEGEGPSGIVGAPMNEVDQRNLRYLAARLGPLPGWSMGYGYDVENGWATQEELDAWKIFLEEHMGWDHFLGARVGYDEKGLFAVSPRPPRPPHDEHYRAPVGDEYTTWLGGDYIGYTSYRPLYDRYVEVLKHHPEKPSFEEDRFRLRDSKKWNYKDYNEDLTRRGLWHSALAGGVANIWGNLLPSANQEGSRPYPIKHLIKTYGLFFENRFKKEMLSEKKGEVLCLKTPDHKNMIFYQEDTDEVNMNLQNMPSDMPAIAVDTRKKYQEINIGPISAKEHSWKAPYLSDWAIAVGKF